MVTISLHIWKTIPILVIGFECALIQKYSHAFTQLSYPAQTLLHLVQPLQPTTGSLANILTRWLHKPFTLRKLNECWKNIYFSKYAIVKKENFERRLIIWFWDLSVIAQGQDRQIYARCRFLTANVKSMPSLKYKNRL